MSIPRFTGSSLATAAALSLVLSGCGKGGQGPVTTAPQSPPPIASPTPSSALAVASPTPTPAPAVASPTPTPALSATSPSAELAGTPSGSGSQTVALTTSGWIAGFKITVGQAKADLSTHSLTLDVKITNTAQRDNGLNLASAEILLDPGDETGLVPVRGLMPTTDIIAGSTAHGTLRFDISPGFSLAKAQLVLGKPANHQWFVPLQPGRAATGEAPVTLQPPATMRTVSSVYYRITSAQLLPWSCSGITPFSAYVPSDKQTSVVAIKGTVGAGQLPGSTGGIETVSIIAPDGTTAASTTAPLKTWSSNQSVPNVLQCLPVPANSHGVFTITISDQQHSLATAKITVP